MSDYLRAADGLNITRTVYVEVGVGASQRYEEADLAITLCRSPDNPLAGVVMSGDICYGHFWRYLEGYPPRRWIKGVRQGVPEDLGPTTAFVRGVRRLGEMDILFELNTDIQRSRSLIDLCPETRFVIDHCGGLTWEMLADERRTAEWARHIKSISRNPNVACKISGIVATAPSHAWRNEIFAAPLRHLIRCFGPRRLMFAGDWPICTLGMSLSDWAHALSTLLQNQSDSDRLAIFHDTAVYWYRLEEGV